MECYEQLYANKSDDLYEIARFLKRQNLPKKTKGKIEDMDGFISMKGPIHKFTGKLYQMVMEEIMPILQRRVFQETEEKLLPNHFIKPT